MAFTNQNEYYLLQIKILFITLHLRQGLQAQCEKLDQPGHTRTK